MRDGVRLGTDVYLPDGAGPFPVILLRSPYNKDLGAGLGADARRRGYGMVIQDTRGRFASEGENLPFEADGWAGHWDGWDTVQWVRRQPWCNGKIGTYGGSASPANTSPSAPPASTTTWSFRAVCSRRR